MAEDESVRDLKRALHGSKDPPPTRERGMSHSASVPTMDSPNNLMHPDVGRARDIAQPGGFRREHLQRSNPEMSQEYKPLLDSLLNPLVLASLGTSSHEGEEQGRNQKGSSNVATVLLILKSTVGGTLIVIPGAFKDAGLLSASIVLIVVACTEISCMILLIHCNRKMGGGSYGDIIRKCFGAVGAWAVDVSLILSQCGFVCAEMLYVAKNGQGFMQGVGINSITETHILLGQLVLAIPMSWIRHLKYFKYTNALANGTVLVALIILLVYACTGFVKSDFEPDDVKYFTAPILPHGKGWLLFAGTATFSFECINFVIPMYEAHEKKETFIPILVATLCGVVFLFIAFGGINYFRYGEDTKPVLTLNLPPGDAMGKALPVGFALASLLNVPLFLYPASITIEGHMFRGVPSSLWRKWKKNMVRSVLMVVCVIISIVGKDSIEALISLIGSVCCVPLAFIYPTAAHMILCKPSFLGIIMDVIVCLLGFFLLVMTTMTAIQSIMQGGS